MFAFFGLSVYKSCMLRELRMAAAVGFLIFIGSFLLPAAKASITDLPGYMAAWNILKSPFVDFPESPWRMMQLALIWPANILIVAAFICLLMGKLAGTRYLAAYGLAGQLYWLFSNECRVEEFGIGYWTWLFAGLLVFGLTILGSSLKFAVEPEGYTTES